MHLFAYVICITHVYGLVWLVSYYGIGDDSRALPCILENSLADFVHKPDFE